MRSRDRSIEPFPLVRSFQAFFFVWYVVLSSSCLFVVLWSYARVMLEGARSKSLKIKNSKNKS
jgi:hypothetical protein